MKNKRELFFNEFNSFLNINGCDIPMIATINIYKNLLIYVLPEENLEILLDRFCELHLKNSNTSYEILMDEIKSSGIYSDVIKKPNNISISVNSILDDVLHNVMNTEQGWIFKQILESYYTTYNLK